MGLQDRDYMWDRQRHSSPFTPAKKEQSTLVVVLTFLVVSVVLFIGFEWLLTPRGATGVVEKLRGAIQLQPPASSLPKKAMEPPAGWVACVVDGQRVFSPDTCPRTGEAPQAVQPTDPPVNAESASLSIKNITLFHCKAFSGGTFWANSHCNQHKGLVDRMVEVPAGLPFGQQVQLAEHQRSEATKLQSSNQPHTRPTGALAAPAQDRTAECTSLASQINHWDAMARQPQSAKTQDWIRTQRHKARDRQFALRC